jgi:hypothetical protein
VTPDQDSLKLVDDAIAYLDQVLEVLNQIPKKGAHAITVDGIEHELHGLAARLRSLRDDVAPVNDRPA